MYLVEIKIGDYIITRYISDLKILDELYKDNNLYEVIRVTEVKEKKRGKK